MRYVVAGVVGMLSGVVGHELSARLQWTRLEHRLVLWLIAVAATGLICGSLWWA